MKKGSRGVYHIGASQTCSKYEFAGQLAKVFELDDHLIQPVSIRDSTLLAPRPTNTSLTTKKVSRELGVSMPDVRSGLEHFRALRDSGFATELKKMGGRFPSAETKDWRPVGR